MSKNKQTFNGREVIFNHELKVTNKAIGVSKKDLDIVTEKLNPVLIELNNSDYLNNSRITERFLELHNSLTLDQQFILFSIMASKTVKAYVTANPLDKILDLILADKLEDK